MSRRTLATQHERAGGDGNRSRNGRAEPAARRGGASARGGLSGGARQRRCGASDDAASRHSGQHAASRLSEHDVGLVGWFCCCRDGSVRARQRICKPSAASLVVAVAASIDRCSTHCNSTQLNRHSAHAYPSTVASLNQTAALHSNRIARPCSPTRRDVRQQRRTQGQEECQGAMGQATAGGTRCRSVTTGNSTRWSRAGGRAGDKLAAEADGAFCCSACLCVLVRLVGPVDRGDGAV